MILRNVIFRRTLNNLPSYQRGMIATGIIGAAYRQPIGLLLKSLWVISRRGAKGLIGFPLLSILPANITLSLKSWSRLLIVTILRKGLKLIIGIILMIPLRMSIFEYLLSQSDLTNVKDLVIPILNTITIPWLDSINGIVHQLKDSTILHTIVTSKYTWIVLGLSSILGAFGISFSGIWQGLDWIVLPVFSSLKRCFEIGWWVTKGTYNIISLNTNIWILTPLRTYMVLNHPITYEWWVHHTNNIWWAIGTISGSIYQTSISIIRYILRWR